MREGGQVLLWKKNNRRCWHRVRVPSSPAGAGDAFCFPSFLSSWPCPFPGAGELRVRPGRCHWGGAGTERMEQSGNGALEPGETGFWAQLCLISAFTACLSLNLSIYQMGVPVLFPWGSKDVCHSADSTLIQYLCVAWLVLHRTSYCRE